MERGGKQSCQHIRLSEAGYLISANTHQSVTGLKQQARGGSTTGELVLQSDK